LVTYFGVILAEIYFYCYYGTTLAEEVIFLRFPCEDNCKLCFQSNTLTNAIYMGNWYDYDVKSRKALITLMEGSKQPMTVTAGKIIDLSLSTFVAVIFLHVCYNIISSWLSDSEKVLLIDCSVKKLPIKNDMYLHI
jgi:hypothetical protein